MIEEIKNQLKTEMDAVLGSFAFKVKGTNDEIVFEVVNCSQYLIYLNGQINFFRKSTKNYLIVSYLMMIEDGFLTVTSDICEDLFNEIAQEDVADVLCDGPSARFQTNSSKIKILYDFEAWKNEFISFIQKEIITVLNKVQ